MLSTSIPVDKESNDGKAMDTLARCAGPTGRVGRPSPMKDRALGAPGMLQNYCKMDPSAILPDPLRSDT